LGPDNASPLTVSVALPELLKVIDWLLALPTIWLVKITAEGASDATAAIPAPDRAMIEGLPAAFVAIVSTADRVPVADGLNSTFTAQACPGFKEVPQVLWNEKSTLFAPLKLTLPIANDAVPVLLRDTDSAELEVPTTCPEKTRPGDESDATGAVPVPLSATD
jgi:hypothetical protein